MSKKRNCNV